MSKIKISIVVTVLDWFDIKEVELDIKKFDYFTLECSSLLWTLKCWKGKLWEKQVIMKRYELSNNQSISKLIDELEIREIKSVNPKSNRSIKSLFESYAERTLHKVKK